MQTIIVDGTTYRVKFDRDPLDYHGASEYSAAQYDPTIPLFEVLNDE